MITLAAVILSLFFGTVFGYMIKSRSIGENPNLEELMDDIEGFFK